MSEFQKMLDSTIKYANKCNTEVKKVSKNINI